jgi:hypothetical protein
VGSVDAIEPMIELLARLIGWIRHRRSKVTISDGEVRIANFPAPTKTFQVAAVDRFESSLTGQSERASSACVLILRDGRMVPVLAASDEELSKTTRWNNAIADVRANLT